MYRKCGKIIVNICEETDSGRKSVLPLRQTTAVVGIPEGGTCLMSTTAKKTMALDFVEPGDGLIDNSAVSTKVPEGVTQKMLYKDIIYIAWPALVELTLTQLTSMADLMMVGQLGPWAITAVGLCNQPKFLLNTAFMAMNVGATAMVARYKGAGEHEKANKIMRQALVMTLCFSLIATVLGLLFTEPLIRFLGSADDPMAFQGAVDYLLTGKAFCGHCGAAMIGDSGTSKDGTRHYYYTCQARKARKGCAKKSVTKDYLESTVISFVLDHVLSEDHIESLADAVMALQEEELKSSPLAAMEAEYAETKKKIDNINDAIAAGIWNSSTSARLKVLEDAAETLRVSVETLRYSQSQLLSRDRVLFFLRRFTKGNRNDPLLRRSIIETFINAVYVFDDHLDLVINNCEGNQRFPLESLPDPGPSCSDILASGVPVVTHPNTQVTIYRIAV